MLFLSDFLHKGVHQTITLASTNMNKATNAREALKLGEKSWVDFFFSFLERKYNLIFKHLIKSMNQSPLALEGAM